MYSSDCQGVMSLLCGIRGLQSAVFIHCAFYLCNLSLEHRLNLKKKKETVIDRMICLACRDCS
jgi:hypothetical protein